MLASFEPLQVSLRNMAVEGLLDRGARDTRAAMKKLALLGLLSMISVSGCGAGAVNLQPTIPTVPCGSAIRPDMIEVQDRRGYDDGKNVGFTKTGLLNSKTPVFTDPPPAELLRAALTKALSSCTRIGRWRLDVALSRFQVSEETGAFTEDVIATIRYRVRITSADGKILGQFGVASEARATSAWDVTDQASDVITRAVQDSVKDFLTKLASLEKQ